MNPDQLDRACGAVLGTAVGDALGAGYEFGCATVGSDGPQMIGGGLGNFAPGEWTDDTTMAWCILEVAATGADLRPDESLDRIARNFRTWFDSRPPDIGIQTRAVIAQAGFNPTGATMAATAYDLHQQTGRSGGNGSLMRTSPVALAHLDDATAAADAARRISGLTHYDSDAGDACVLWTLAIRHAILTGELDVRVGLPYLSEDAADRWTALIDEAEASDPNTFSPNGWVVIAFQAAWSAIIHTPVPESGDGRMPHAHLAAALATAVDIGNDTDTVGAIAGALLGARWGASAVPVEWRAILHGYPGITGEDLLALAVRTVQATNQPATTDHPNETRGGSPATRIEAMTYNSHWTDHDREIVTRELDRVADRTAYLWRTKSDAYIRATDSSGRALVYVASGYLWWSGDENAERPEGALRDGNGWILDLSTRGSSGPRIRPSEELALAMCSRCGIYELSATGVCFGCDT